MTILFYETNVADKNAIANDGVYELGKGGDEMKATPVGTEGQTGSRLSK